MEKQYCSYCGRRLEESCSCEQQAINELIQELDQDLKNLMKEIEQKEIYLCSMIKTLNRKK